jgi:hypothetical protein
MFRRLIAAVGGAIAELLTRIMFMGLSLIIGFWIFDQIKGDVWNGINKKTSIVSIPSMKNVAGKVPLSSNVLKELDNIGKKPLFNVPKTREQISRENGERAYMQMKSEIAAFKAQYQKPEVCYNMKDQKTRIFCANHFMREKKEWDKAQKIKIN